MVDIHHISATRDREACCDARTIAGRSHHPIMGPPERHVSDRLSSAMYRLAALEQRAVEAADSPRAAMRLLAGVRKLAEELQRGFAELQELTARSASAERAAATVIAQARMVFDWSPVACLVLEPTGLVAEANAAAARFLNVSHRHLLGKLFPLFLSAERDAFVDRLRHLQASDGAQRWTAHMRPRERSAVECAFVAVSDPDGRVLLMLVPGSVAEPTAAALPEEVP